MKGIRTVVLGLVVLGEAGGSGAIGTPAPHQKLGLFTRDSDIGTVQQKGGTTFDPRTGSYQVVGNGDDLWAAKDDFHFVSRKVTGNVAIAATISPVGGSTEPHSKAGLMVRQDLTPDSPYADVVVHENGLVSLQYRAKRGGDTYEIDAPHTGPGRFQLERRGDSVSISIADADGTLHRAGAAVQVRFEGPYHVGLLVCSHSDTQTKTVDFTDVKITKP